MRLASTSIPCILLVLMSCVGATAYQANLKTTLKQRYQDKVFYLRTPLSGSKLSFNSQGEPVGKVGPGYWSSDAGLLIDQLELQNSKLHLRATRVIFLFDTKDGTFRRFRTKAKVEIDIDVNPNWTDETSFTGALDRIVTPDSAVLAKEASGYWACWLTGELTHDAGKQRWNCHDKDEAMPGDKRQPDTHDVTLSPKDGSISAPRAIYTPDPEYTKATQEAGLRAATVVLWATISEEGRATNIQIQRPVGAGLDDKAIEAVQRWRFRPAMKNGSPVAVRINIEINFRL